jgi:hypothetical protein
MKLMKKVKATTKIQSPLIATSVAFSIAIVATAFSFGFVSALITIPLTSTPSGTGQPHPSPTPSYTCDYTYNENNRTQGCCSFVCEDTDVTDVDNYGDIVKCIQTDRASCVIDNQDMIPICESISDDYAPRAGFVAYTPGHTCEPSGIPKEYDRCVPMDLGCCVNSHYYTECRITSQEECVKHYGGDWTEGGMCRKKAGSYSSECVYCRGECRDSVHVDASAATLLGLAVDAGLQLLDGFRCENPTDHGTIDDDNFLQCDTNLSKNEKYPSCCRETIVNVEFTFRQEGVGKCTGGGKIKDVQPPVGAGLFEDKKDLGLACKDPKDAAQQLASIATSYLEKNPCTNAAGDTCGFVASGTAQAKVNECPDCNISSYFIKMNKKCQAVNIPGGFLGNEYHVKADAKLVQECMLDQAYAY